MLKYDIIEKSNSAYCAPVLLVPKKKPGKWRFCVDFRKLNKKVVNLPYPLPRIDDCLNMLAGKKYFSSIDMVSGFWSLPVRPEDRHKLAFATWDGMFQYKRSPFGLKTSPAYFQRMMNAVLGDLRWSCCLCYIDDILIFSETLEDHIDHLDQVLSRMEKTEVMCQADKCAFLRESLTFLGHVVSADGISADPMKTATIQAIQFPKSKKEMRQFLGITGYFRKFVRDYARRAKPLTDMLRDDATLVETKEASAAFHFLKKVLVSPRVLKHPQFDRPFLIHTDACNHGIGATLIQIHDGKEHPIAFISRTLLRPLPSSGLAKPLDLTSWEQK